uniref:XK-related protein n=2 Tax=Callorhinchus milii TaxID=7868 RepID=A0A4W3I0I3_CALMI
QEETHPHRPESIQTTLRVPHRSGVMTSLMKPPGGIFVSVFLFGAELIAALCLSTTYKSNGDQIWQGLTLLFALVPAVLVQLTLTFVHRDLSKDRPLILFLHLLLLGPFVRGFEAFCIYLKHGKAEEPYVSIIRKQQMPKNGYSEEIEKEVGQSEGKIFTHRAAFNRTSVIQAFLGSAPQLTLQLYVSVKQQHVSPARGVLMVISLLSIVYGALRCNILAIKLMYDEYDVNVKPAAYICIFLWRSFEIATRVVILVLFSSVMQIWILPVVLLNFFIFFLFPWILFWHSRSPFPENIEKTFTRLGTTMVLCCLTFLFAGINIFCWSAVQLNLTDPDLINKSHNWYIPAVYYLIRFIENAGLVFFWYLFKTDVYNYICAPLLVLQLFIGYLIAIFFMLVFYQFCHPCKKLFTSSISKELLTCIHVNCSVCICCKSSKPPEKAVLDHEQGT